MTRPRVLVFAYACDPAAGSEPAAGWSVVRAIARFADAVVLVGPEHEQAIQEWQGRHAVDRTVFVTVREPWWERFIPRTRIGRFLIYLGWLTHARAAAQRLQPSHFDLAWHATYSAYWLPTPAATLGLPCIWGPVGGAVTSPLPLWPALGWAGCIGELIDLVTVRAMALLPQTRRTWRHVSVAIVQNAQTLMRLPASMQQRAIVLNHALLAQRERPDSDARREVVVFAGSLESRKAPSLVIRAMPHASESVRLLMIGTGPQLACLKALARRLHVADRVTFAGHLPRGGVQRAWQSAAAAVFTGVREEGGIALAEAMLAGTPVIVLAHGGAGSIAASTTDSDRVALIPPASVATTVRAIGGAMSRFVLNPRPRTDALLDPQSAADQLEAIARRALAAASPNAVGVPTEAVVRG